EVAFEVHEGKAVAAAEHQLGVVAAELLAVPVLDQAVEDVEVVWEVDDPGRIAVREADRNAAGEGAARRHEAVLEHGGILACGARSRGSCALSEGTRAPTSGDGGAGYYTFSFTKDGEAKTPPARYSFTYVKRGGQWLIVDHHSSAMPPTPK